MSFGLEKKTKKQRHTIVCWGGFWAIFGHVEILMINCAHAWAILTTRGTHQAPALCTDRLTSAESDLKLLYDRCIFQISVMIVVPLKALL